MSKAQLLIDIPEGDRDVAAISVVLCALEEMQLDDDELRRVLAFVLQKLGYNTFNFSKETR